MKFFFKMAAVLADFPKWPTVETVENKISDFDAMFCISYLLDDSRALM